MKKVRLTLVVLSAIYVALAIFFPLNDDSLINNFSLLKLINYLQVWIIVGLALLVSVILVGSLYIQSLKRRYNKLEKEYNVVKGRVYEIEEERKAEKARQEAEEEETEKKLEAFNQSLKSRGGRDRSGPAEPRREEIDLGRLDNESDADIRRLPPGE